MPMETTRLIRMDSPDGYLDSNTAPELCSLDGRLLEGSADGHWVTVTGGLC